MKTLDFQSEETPSVQVNFPDGEQIILVVKNPPASKQGEFEQGRQDLITIYGKDREVLQKADKDAEAKAKKDKKVFTSILTKVEADRSVQFMLDIMSYHVENLDRDKFGGLVLRRLVKVKDAVVVAFAGEEESPAEKKSE